MANIPVEPRRKQPWWLWPLVGLGALLLLLLLTRGCNNEEGDLDDNDEVSTAGPIDPDAADGLEDDGFGDDLDDAAAATGAAVTSFDDLFVADAASSLAGRRVDIDRARVVAVPGDSTFVVAPEGDDARHVVVVLDDAGESETGAGGADGRYNVDVGDVVDLVGTVETYRAGMAGEAALDAGHRQELTDRGFYVRTRRVDLREAAPAAN